MLLCVKEGEIRKHGYLFIFCFEIIYILPVYFGKRIFRKYKPETNEVGSLHRIEVGENKADRIGRDTFWGIPFIWF